MKATLSLAYELEADAQAIAQAGARLDARLAGQIKDLVAAALAGLDFDLRERYCLFSPTRETIEPPARGLESIPVWSAEAHSFVDVRIGSPEWFEMLDREGQFRYTYAGLTFTVRPESRTVRGREYRYWRAYATVDGKLVAKQLGKTKDLTKEALDDVGEYFSEKKAGRE